MNGQGFEMESRETKRIETKHRRIVTPIPVPESFELIKEMQKYEPISNAGQPLIVWDHTEDGYKVCDPYGNKFIDFSSGVMITNAGHGNPEIIDAIKKTLDKPLLCAYLHPTKERVEAAKAICSVSPIPDSKAFMLSAGTEAVEAAVKIARTHGKMVGGPAKKVIVSLKEHSTDVPSLLRWSAASPLSRIGSATSTPTFSRLPGPMHTTTSGQIPPSPASRMKNVPDSSGHHRRTWR